jgi:Eukaryotic porin
MVNTEVYVSAAVAVAAAAEAPCFLFCAFLPCSPSSGTCYKSIDLIKMMLTMNFFIFFDFFRCLYQAPQPHGEVGVQYKGSDYNTHFSADTGSDYELSYAQSLNKNW